MSKESSYQNILDALLDGDTLEIDISEQPFSKSSCYKAFKNFKSTDIGALLVGNRKLHIIENKSKSLIILRLEDKSPIQFKIRSDSQNASQI